MREEGDSSNAMPISSHLYFRLTYLKVEAHGTEELQFIVGRGDFEEIQSVAVPFLDGVSNALPVTRAVLTRRGRKTARFQRHLNEKT